MSCGVLEEVLFYCLFNEYSMLIGLLMVPFLVIGELLIGFKMLYFQCVRIQIGFRRSNKMTAISTCRWWYFGYQITCEGLFDRLSC